MAGDAAACEAYVRDVTMTDTVEWVLGRERRISVLAHNGHIQRTPIATDASAIDTLGVHLAHRLGDRYLTIGTSCGGGEIIVPRTTDVDGSHETELIIRNLPPAGSDTIDGALDSSLAAIGLLDLRTLDPGSASVIDGAHRMRVLDQVVDIDVRRAFGLLIHVARISLWTSTVNAALPDDRAGNAPGR
jgi:erythromycin esterase